MHGIMSWIAMQFKLRPLQRTNFNGLEVLTRSQLASEAQLSAPKKNPDIGRVYFPKNDL